MNVELLKAQRDKLLKEVKVERSADYRKGYVDGILDMYNTAIHMPVPAVEGAKE